MPTNDVHRKKVPAKWREFVKSDKKERLSVLDARLDRNIQTRKDITAELKYIRGDAIKRMRRAEGRK